MPRYKDEPVAVRVYTVCDESKYLIVRNVPSLGCGDELFKLFSTYGDVEECKPMDAVDSEPFTDVYWIKFHQVNNARFAKRKLDEFVFIGNRLQVSYAPQFETLADTKEKLEGRTKEVLGRLNYLSIEKSYYKHLHIQINSAGRGKLSKDVDSEALAAAPSTTVSHSPQLLQSCQSFTNKCEEKGPIVHSSSQLIVSADKEYFPSNSMNQTVQLVSDKLNKIQSSTQHSEAASSKKPRIDNRRRI
ncbi:hypothetical protein LIER_04407 [Lithospermum erythrorhizon]|uniref:RNA-binding protein 48 n=1 Tax=Lithospermum erythrorhizon TaxID=34254 RepID=A0AAV3P1F7_LITER